MHDCASDSLFRLCSASSGRPKPKPAPATDVQSSLLISCVCVAELEVRFPRFRGTGYLALPVLRDGYKEFAVAVEFRPEAKNGLLIFSSEFDDARKDFFAITLNNGFVEFR